MIEATVPVLIVGGGPTGLTASMLLSRYGVASLLVSHRAGTSHLPKAHILNQRSMEIFRELRLDEEITQRAAPPENFRYFGWYAGVAGRHADYGRCIARIECWGNGGGDPRYQAASPCLPTNLAQIWLEPVLKERAESLAPGAVRFHHEVVAIEQDSDGCTVTIHDRARDRRYEVRARYVLSCDGGRTIGKLVGATLEGQRNLGSNVSVYMTADLSKWLRDPEVLLRWIVHPNFGEPLSGVLCPMGPDCWGPDSEQWVFHWLLPWGDPRIADDEAVLARMQATLGIPDFRPEVHVISRWTVEGLVASRYQLGRVFLLGDAAHRHPPTGALGLNTGVQDSYNMCWKIAAVLRGEAHESLLATYETERRPIGSRVVTRALANFAGHLGNMAALEMAPEQGQHNWARMRMLWSDDVEARALRRRFDDHLAQQAIEFNAHNLEIGYRYESSAIVPDGSPAPQPIDDDLVYEPSTRPGGHLPHAWVTRHEDRRALCDLTGHGEFTLLVGEEGQAWIEAAQGLASARPLRLKTLRIGCHAGDWLDTRFTWLAQRQISPAGALLVRPDRIIAWRHAGAHAEPRAALAQALDQIQGRR